MVYYTDECVGCPPEMGCLGESCPNKKVPHFRCDDCKEDVDTLYDEFDGQEFGQELCRDCVEKRLHIIHSYFA